MNHLRPLGKHYHRCRFRGQGCDNKVECSDVFLERNYDGYPEVICRFDEDERYACDECEESAVCPDCGLPERLPHEMNCPYWDREVEIEPPLEAYDEEVDNEDKYEYEA